MDREGKRVNDPVAHQPSKAELVEDVSIDATPEALVRAITRGGAQRLATTETKQESPNK